MPRWLKSLGLAGAAALALGPPVGAEPLIAQVSLNGADTGHVVTFERSGATLFAPWRELLRIGLAVDPPPHADLDSLADLARLPGLNYRFEAATQSVALEVDPGLLPHHDLAAAIPAAGVLPDRAAFGAAFDYAVNVQDGDAWAGGRARVFGRFGVLSHGFVLDSRAGRARRLDTNLVIDDARRGRSITLGDFISDGGAGARAVRAAGLHISTEPALRPDLFTPAAPQLEGQAALPSTVDLLVDGVRRYAGRAEAGRFTLFAPPLVDGRGAVSLVVTDPMGRQSVVTQAFYSSSRLLRPGVTEYSFDAGALRSNYGLPGDRYGRPFAAASARRGLTPALTVEGHAEAASHQRSGGVAAVATLRNEVLFSAAFDVSSAREGLGAHAQLEARRDTPAYSLWANLEHRTARYRELGVPEFGRPQSDLQFGGSMRADRWGSVSVSYTRRTGGGSDFGLWTAGWSGGVGRLNLFSAVTATSRRFGGRTISIGLTLPLDRRQVSAGYDSQGGGRFHGEVSSTPPDLRGVSWRVGADATPADDQARIEGEAQLMADQGEIGLAVAADRRGAALRAYGSGSIVWLGGRMRLARQNAGAMALVETGQPNVALRVENRTVGRTGRDGAYLAVNLPADTPSRIEIVAESVDVSQAIVVDALAVRPPRNAGVTVRLPVRRLRAAALQVVDASGRPPPVGARVRLNGQPAGLVGYDGWIYLPDMEPRNVIEIDGGGTHCRFRLEPPQGDAPPATVVCRPDGPDVRITLAALPGEGPGGEVLHGPDRPGEFRRLSRRGLESGDGTRGRYGQVRLHLPGLRRLFVHFGHSVGRLWFGHLAQDEARDGEQHDKLPAV
jgi:outer membrane usher protein